MTIPMGAFVMILGVSKTAQRPTWALLAIIGVLFWHDTFSNYSFFRINKFIKLYQMARKPEVRDKFDCFSHFDVSEKISAHSPLLTVMAHRRAFFNYPIPFDCPYKGAGNNLWNMWYQPCKDMNTRGKDLDRIIIKLQKNDFLSDFLSNSNRFDKSVFQDYIVLTRKNHAEWASNLVKLETDNGTVFWGDTLQFPKSKWVFRSVWGDTFEGDTKLRITARIYDLDPNTDVQVESEQLISFKMSRTNPAMLSIYLDLSRGGPKGLIVKIKKENIIFWLPDSWLASFIKK